MSFHSSAPVDGGLSERGRILKVSKELFRQTLLAQVRLIREGLEDIVSDPALNFQGKLRTVVLFMAEHLPRPEQPFLRDLQTEIRDVWEEIDRARLETVNAQFGKLFEEGIRDGYLREDVDTSLLTLMISGLIQKLVNPAVLSSLPLTASEVFEQIVEILSFGLFTDESRREFTSVDSLSRKKT